jgi:hypothetical protein
MAEMVKGSAGRKKQEAGAPGRSRDHAVMLLPLRGAPAPVFSWSCLLLLLSNLDESKHA